MVRGVCLQRARRYSIVLNNGLLRSDGIYVGIASPTRVNTEPIKASSLFVFSCGLMPNAAQQFADRMGEGGRFVYTDGGDDTGVDVKIQIPEPTLLNLILLRICKLTVIRLPQVRMDLF